jgi:replicative DNA helicase
MSIDRDHKIKELDYDNIKSVTNELKVLYDNLTYNDEADEDLGDDFDDPKTHKQVAAKNKITSGFKCADEVMNGGFDRASLGILLGMTNVGKSMFMHNIGASMADAGFNVAVITLEMAKHKVMKRIGCMRFDIHPDDYDKFSNDDLAVKTKINQLKNKNSNLFETSQGKIFVKKYNTCDCSITDLDLYVKKLTEIKKIKLDVLIVDYLGIMGVEKGLDLRNNLYLKGKHLAEGLRYLADKYNMFVLTATQVSKDSWGANDLKLDDIPESKAIAETADSIWGIIRTDEMQRQNLYKLKVLKLRDGEHHLEEVIMDFNPKNLRIWNDRIQSKTK